MSKVRPPRLVGYIRVSTREQGASGLGLEAQIASIDCYAASSGCELVSTYREVESGKRNDRPQLALAVAHAKRLRARLVIAKIDRLARNVAFVANLMESKVPFVACDMPEANDLTIHIIAAVAQAEAKTISERTKNALAALKARGNYSEKKGRVVTLGAPHHLTREGALKGNQRAVERIKRNRREAYEYLRPALESHRAIGLSYNAIAKLLNANGEETRRGCAWTAMQVSRVCKGFSVLEFPSR